MKKHNIFSKKEIIIFVVVSAIVIFISHFLSRAFGPYAGCMLSGWFFFSVVFLVGMRGLVEILRG